jgi:hypothetical protein
VLANHVTKITHNGKKGDTIHIPVPGRNAANSIAESGTVTLNSDTATKISVVINKHFEWSMLIEDVAAIQALDSMRRFYTDDAGYALATMVDWHLHVLGTGLQGATVDTTGIDTPAGALTYNAGTPGVGAVIGGDGTTAWAATTDGNGTALTDAGVRKMIQTLDDANVPLSNRIIVIPPVEKKNLLGLARFTEQAFVGEAGAANSIRNGLVGDIYGMPVYVSTNCPTPVDAGGTNAFRAGMILHKSAFAYAEQLGIRTQTQYKQEFLSELFTADMLYGTAELRDNAGIAFIVPA